jgi:outer membrane protein OmpA-like peptidoglycan-associated protein
MLLADSEGKARKARVQPAPKTRWGSKGMAMAGLCLTLGVPGCADVPNAVNPVSWWHSMEGGAIAEDRPPPPRDTDPFPRLTDAPQKPAGMPDWEWQAMSATLAQQRAQAKSYAAANPIPTLPKPAATAATPAATAPAATPAPAKATASATTTDSDDAGSAMTFDGPSATPKTAGPKTVAIPGASAGADTTTKFFAPNNQLTVPGALVPPPALPEEATLPPVPATMPVPPSVPGFDVPAMPTPYVQPIPVPQPAAYVPPAPLPAIAPLLVAFPPGSAILTVRMQIRLKTFAASRKAARIAVTGFGDATGTAIDAQAAVMPLALERARAITVELLADGVAPTQLATDARALGRGGLARLID